MKILLIRFGDIENKILNAIKNKVSKIFNLQVEILPEKLEQPECRKRGLQLNAEDFLPVISKINSNYKLALTDKDLYVPGLNFVFGLAFITEKSCVISLARLTGNLYIERAVKEAIHEIGHLSGLQHCQDEKCVMHFSNCLLDTDKKDKEPCEKCKEKLKKSKYL